MNDLVRVAANVTPMTMLQLAVEQNADLDKLQKLMDLHERWTATEARKAFVAAMTRFKMSPPHIEKNKQVRFETNKGTTEYWHATLDHVSEVLGAGLSAVGITHRWEVEQADAAVKVTCILTHEMGHSEKVTMSAGLDQSGGKNNIQALGSVVSYLQRYTLKAATGTAEANADTDGMVPDEAPPIEPDEAGKALLENCGSAAELQKVWNTLTKDQKLSLQGVKNACKANIQAAEESAK